MTFCAEFYTPEKIPQVKFLPIPLILKWDTCKEYCFQYFRSLIFSLFPAVSFITIEQITMKCIKNAKYTGSSRELRGKTHWRVSWKLGLFESHFHGVGDRREFVIRLSDDTFRRFFSARAYMDSRISSKKHGFMRKTRLTRIVRYAPRSEGRRFKCGFREAGGKGAGFSLGLSRFQCLRALGYFCYRPAFTQKDFFRTLHQDSLRGEAASERFGQEVGSRESMPCRAKLCFSQVHWLMAVFIVTPRKNSHLKEGPGPFRSNCYEG